MKSSKLIMPAAVIVVCMVVMLCVSAGLSGVQMRNERLERNETLEFLLPESENFVEVVYSDEHIRSVWQGETGYVIETVVDGYVGKIALWVGVDADGWVTGVTVREMVETLGLGADAMHNADFLAQFLGTKGDAEVGVNVDALSGATVTSRAIAKGVNAAAGYVTGTDVSSGATEWGG